MKAAVIRGARDLVSIEVPSPEIEDGMVLIRVSHVGICGSDLSYYKKGALGSFEVLEPLIPGHEFSGVVARDDRADGFSAGTKVTMHPATPGICLPGLEGRPNIWPQSRYLGSAMTMPHEQGAMASFMLADPVRLRILPENMPLRRAALAEPLAVGLHAMSLVGDLKGRRVLVSGAGPIGVLLALACLINGADVVITDVLPEAVDRAVSLGVTKGLLIGRDPVPKETFDVVFEASGAIAALASCVESVVRGGAMVQVGLPPAGPQPIDVSILATRELRYYGSFRFNEELDEAIAMLSKHANLDAVITHEFALDDVVEAFDCAADPKLSLKVLVAL